MNYELNDGVISFPAGEDFDPVKIFECGQCFRWNQDDSGIYSGVAMDRQLSIWRDGDFIRMRCTPEEFEAVWRYYFDMDTDYARIRREIAVDTYMAGAAEHGAGIRILRQDGWEALCSFIISQCNNIPRIKGIVERLCSSFGAQRDSKVGPYYTFPGPGTIARLEVQDLQPIKAGFRADYIISAARAVDSGKLNLDELRKAPAERALIELKGLSGVGEKVASCVMLFGLYKTEAFPIDVWMKRAIKEHYGGKLSPDIFGNYAGIAQQYMFFHARDGKETA